MFQLSGFYCRSLGKWIMTTVEEHTVEARKLEYDSAPNPKPKKEGNTSINRPGPIFHFFAVYIILYYTILVIVYYTI